MSKEKYPHAEKQCLNSARNFICACFGLDSEKRAKFSKLWKHQFVGGVELFPEDNIWVYKANTSNLRKKVKRLEIFSEVDRHTTGYKSVLFESREKSNKEKWQKIVNYEESRDKDNISNIQFSPELNNRIEGRSLYKDKRMCKCAHMQGEHGECFDTEDESSLLPEEIKEELDAYSHYEGNDVGKMNGKINNEADNVKTYKGKENIQNEEEMFVLSKYTALNDVKKNEKVPWNKSHYVKRVYKELSETNLLTQEDEFEITNCENVPDSCKSVTLHHLMKHAFRDSLVYRISHPDNFLNKLSTKLTHTERKKDVIRSIEKDKFCEMVVDEDSAKMQVKTRIFSDNVKGLPLKILDILLTHLW